MMPLLCCTRKLPLLPGYHSWIHLEIQQHNSAQNKYIVIIDIVLTPPHWVNICEICIKWLTAKLFVPTGGIFMSLIGFVGGM